MPSACVARENKIHFHGDTAQSERTMDATSIFEQSNTVAGIAAVGKEYKLHDAPKRLSLDEWGNGTGLLFEPCTGFHFGLCGPWDVTHAIVSTCRFERPVVAFMLVLSGEFTMQVTQNADSYINLSSGMFMIGELSDITSSMYMPVQEGYTHIGMVVEVEHVSSVFGESSYKHVKTLLGGQENAAGEGSTANIRYGIATTDCIQSVTKLLGNNFDSSDIFFRHSLLNIFINILRCVERHPVVCDVCLMEDDIEVLQKIKSDIGKNFLTIDSMHHLCTKYAMNRVRMHNGFKKLFNTTIAKYIHKCKMEYAHMLLSGRRMNVSQSAFAVGYSNIGHFISAYKRIYGETPKQTIRRTAA